MAVVKGIGTQIDALSALVPWQLQENVGSRANKNDDTSRPADSAATQEIEAERKILTRQMGS